MTFKGLPVGPACLADAGFVEHVEGRSITLSQVAQGTASNRELSLGIDLSRDRSQVSVGTGCVTPEFKRLRHGACDRGDGQW